MSATARRAAVVTLVSGSIVVAAPDTVVRAAPEFISDLILRQ